VTTDQGVRWTWVSFGLAIGGWVATCIAFHTEWSFPFTPIAVAVPAVLAGLPLLMRSTRARHAMRVVAAVLLFVCSWLAMFSAGMFFIPAAIAMVVAAVSGRAVPERSSSRPSASSPS